MTVTIPTGDLVGLLTDIIPFASTDKEDLILHCVHLKWDGQQLHAFTTDRYRIAWATWDPADPPATDRQDDLLTEWGGTDSPWHVTVPLPDAKDIVAAFKLPKDGTHISLTVELNRFWIRINRAKETGLSALTMSIEDQNTERPDLVTKLNEFALRQGKVDQLGFTAKLLADFAKVRPTGPMVCTFTEPTGPVLVRIGERFQAVIMPVRVGTGEADVEAAFADINPDGPDTSDGAGGTP